MKGPRGLSLAQASGWLFADLLLMLVIVVLGGQSSNAGDAPPCPGCPSSSASSSSAAPSSTSSASSSPASTAPPASAAVTAPPGLDPHSESITVRNVDVAGVLAHEPRALAHVEREVRRQTARFEGRNAALVLVWGAAASCPSCGIDLSRSQRLADEIAPRMRSYDPAFFPEDDPKLIRPYHDGGGTRNTVRLELFFVRA